MYRNETRCRRGHPRRRASTAARCSSPASSTTASTSPTTPAGRSTRRSTALGIDYVDLFLIHWPLPTLYDGDFVSTWQTLEEFTATAAPAASACRTSRSPTCSGWPRRPTPCPRSTRSRCTRTSPTTTVRAYGARARHRDRGVVADRAGQGARRPGDHARSPSASARRRPRWCCAGTSSAATSCSRSR